MITTRNEYFLGQSPTRELGLWLFSKYPINLYPRKAAMKGIDTFLELINKAQFVAISTHIYPDADGIGSQIALTHALRELGKEVVCVNEEELLERYNYLDPKEVVMSAERFKAEYPKQNIDLFIIVDANNIDRVGSRVQKILENSQNVLFVDHHPCSSAVEAIHCIDPKSAATGQLVGKLIKAMNIPYSKEMALALYTSILIDTSSFRYPTVTGDTHRLLGELLETGIEPSKAYNMIYGTKKISHMKLLGEVLRTAQTTEDESVAWIIVKEDWVDHSTSDHEDTHGFINHLLILDNVKVAIMFRNQGNQVKISFRSDGLIDVGVIAQALGGGGHNHSAATILEGKIDNVVQETVKKVQTILSNI